MQNKSTGCGGQGEGWCGFKTPYPVLRTPYLILILAVFFTLSYGISWEFKRKLSPEQRAQREADSLYMVSRKMYNRGNLDSAEALLTRAIAIKKWEPDYLTSLAMLYERKGAWEKAAAQYREAADGCGLVNLNYQVARLYLEHDSLATALLYLEKYRKEYAKTAEPVLSLPQVEKVIGQIQQRLREEEAMRKGDTVQVDSGVEKK